MEELAESLPDPLRTILGVAGGTAVGHPDIEETVGAELELAAVVIRIRLVDGEELARSRCDGFPASRAELDDARVAVAVRVVDQKR